MNSKETSDRQDRKCPREETAAPAPSTKSDPPGKYWSPEDVYRSFFRAHNAQPPPLKVPSLVESSSLSETTAPSTSIVSFLTPTAVSPPCQEPSPSDQVKQMGEAMVRQDVVALRTLLSSDYNYNSNSRMEGSGTSALHIAARMGYVDMAIVLLEYGANVNLVNAHGETPLMIAALYQQVGMVRHLLQSANADPSIRAKSGANAVDYAMKRPASVLVSTMIVETLLLTREQVSE